MTYLGGAENTGDTITVYKTSIHRTILTTGIYKIISSAYRPNQASKRATTGNVAHDPAQHCQSSRNKLTTSRNEMLRCVVRLAEKTQYFFF